MIVGFSFTVIISELFSKMISIFENKFTDTLPKNEKEYTNNFLENVRKLIPDSFLLIPGVGTQGGSLDEVSSL